MNMMVDGGGGGGSSHSFATQRELNALLAQADSSNVREMSRTWSGSGRRAHQIADLVESKLADLTAEGGWTGSGAQAFAATLRDEAVTPLRDFARRTAGITPQGEQNVSHAADLLPIAEAIESAHDTATRNNIPWDIDHNWEVRQKDVPQSLLSKIDELLTGQDEAYEEAKSNSPYEVLTGSRSVVKEVPKPEYAAIESSIPATPASRYYDAAGLCMSPTVMRFDLLMRRLDIGVTPRQAVQNGADRVESVLGTYAPPTAKEYTGSDRGTGPGGVNPGTGGPSGPGGPGGPGAPGGSGGSGPGGSGPGGRLPGGPGPFDPSDPGPNGPQLPDDPGFTDPEGPGGQNPPGNLPPPGVIDPGDWPRTEVPECPVFEPPGNDLPDPNDPELTGGLGGGTGGAGLGPGNTGPGGLPGGGVGAGPGAGGPAATAGVGGLGSLGGGQQSGVPGTSFSMGSDGRPVVNPGSTGSFGAPSARPGAGAGPLGAGAGAGAGAGTGAGGSTMAGGAPLARPARSARDDDETPEEIDGTWLEEEQSVWGNRAAAPPHEIR